MQRFYNKWWNETLFDDLIDLSNRDKDVRHLFETVFLVDFESEDNIERSCMELGANRLEADRALYNRLNRSGTNLIQMAPLLLPLFGTSYSPSVNASVELKRVLERELRVEDENFGIDPATMLRAKFTCLAVIFDQFDPISYRVNYTIRKEFDELLQPSDRSWFMDLGSMHF